MTTKDILHQIVWATRHALSEAEAQGVALDESETDRLVALLQEGKWVDAGEMIDQTLGKPTDRRWDPLRAYLLGLVHGRVHTNLTYVEAATRLTSR